MARQFMHTDLGYFRDETAGLTIENPRSERVTYVSG